ncbi:hypothetical protein NDN08_007889 [Rhodosorus marinus]|uniref:Acyl-coenzyme A oxidase n=1 Tax=Rhodosorus marinus TaxID=101924 RepID=A0AAV8UYV3_9RHOD|nr:hypothetical protein NDN08_007889 [Rhodosorus marinus]
MTSKVWAIRAPEVDRSSSAASSQELSKYLNRDYVEVREAILEYLKHDLFKPRYDLSFYEFRDLTQERLKHLAKGNFISCFDHINDPGRFFAGMEALTYVDYSITIKCGVHYTLAGGAIALLGTRKHHNKYLPLMDSGELPGCFAMTELGHGSNVMGIETTAVYDHARNSFVLNTGSDLASKVWIGGASQYGRLCTVFAQLTVGGDYKGVHVFVMRIRDDEGNLCKGVRIEEMGHKMGMNGVDNGRIWFDNVVLDKDSLLDRYASIDEQGMYHSPIKSIPARFGAMVGALSTGRVCIAQSAVDACKLGLTIACRYSSDRPQFGKRKIGSYLTHKRRLAPGVAQTYALHLMMLQLKGLVNDRHDPKKIHNLSSGLKAAATWTRVDVLQKCRECCGGMGLLSENQIGGMIVDMNVDVTFEGDNTVLMQQVVKGILAKGIKKPDPIQVRNYSIEELLEALKYREDLLKYKLVQLGDLDANQDTCVDLGWAYADYLTAENFFKEVQRAPPALRDTLQELAVLFALEKMERNAVFYVCDGVIDADGLENLRRRVNDQCNVVSGADGERLNILCEGFGIPEHLITAPIAKGWREFHTSPEIGARM